MTPTRREFIKQFGVMLASLVAVRCTPTASPTPLATPRPTATPSPTSTPMATPTSTPTPGIEDSPPRERLRETWSRFDWLVEEARHWEDYERGDKARFELADDHRAALDELVTAGELDGVVADQVQEGFVAAAYHVWRSNCGNTCYLHTFTLDYKPAGAGQLVQQAELLADMVETRDVDPATIALAQAAVERDIAFLTLSREEVEALYDRLAEAKGGSNDYPPFDELDLEIAPEAAAAARFLVELLLEETE